MSIDTITLAERTRLALQYSLNHARLGPPLCDALAAQHIEGLCRLVQDLVAALPVASEQPAAHPAYIDVEAMLAACVPGGSIADPQAIADAIRAWVAEQPAAQEPNHPEIPDSSSRHAASAAEKLREALAYVGNRNDGDLDTLINRAVHWMRGSHAALEANESIIKRLEADAAAPIEWGDYAVPEGFEVEESFGGWIYTYTDDGVGRASAATWNNPLHAAIAAWEHATELLGSPAEPAAVPDFLPDGTRVEWEDNFGRWHAGTIIGYTPAAYSAELDDGVHATGYARGRFRRLAAREGQ